MDNETAETPPKGRKRSLTSVTLQWFSEKLRRSEQLKEQINSGQYELDSSKVAASIVGDSAE